MADDPKWLALARREIGQKEVTTRNGHNPTIVGYWTRAQILKKDDTPWEPGNDETPWCAAFLGAILADAGIVGSHKALARSYELWGDAVMTGDAPAYRWASIPLGAIVVLNRPEAGPKFGHVGFASEASEKAVKLIGGNQSDAVGNDWFLKSRIVAVRWPKGQPASEYLMWGAEPKMKRRGTRTG